MNKITTVTRQAIADEMFLSELHYSGRQEEPDFLSRLFNLKEMHSNDSRYTTAYEDIFKHMVMNSDWDDLWYLTDPRINLLHCDDATYIKFLQNTLHPMVRPEQGQVAKLVEIYNKNLDPDGFQVVHTSEISGKPIYSIQPKSLGANAVGLNKANIKRYLNSQYVDSQITLMHDNIKANTALAIGTAKELLETTCKSILKQKDIGVSKDWTLPQLIKATSTNLDFKPSQVADAEKAERAILQILSGIGQIVQGVSELRNSYGTGHGKDVEFIRLESKFAKLYVGVVTEIVILFLTTNGEAELVEADQSF